MNEHEKVVKRFTGRGWCSLKEIWLLVAGMAVVVSPLAVQADAPPDETYRETIRIPAREERATVTEGVDSSWRRGGWQSRLSLGVTEAFFDEEDAETLPAIHYDVWKEGSMVNFRVGFEGSNHLPLHQENAQSAAEFPGKVPQVTYMRIPFAIEYIAYVDDKSRFFVGGGPDIIHTANDIGETNVGLHLGLRYGYDFDEHWGVSLEGGYWWGEVDNDPNDVEFDSAYVSPLLTYTF